MVVIMRALIYGAGSVGLGIASCLLKSQANVDVIARDNTVQALRKSGLTRTGIFGNYHAEPVEFGSFTSLNEIEKQFYDYILVCTKSFDSLTAAQDLSNHRPILGEKAKIVLFQNGWGNVEAFLSFFARNQIYNARVITGFGRTKPNEVEITVHADSIHVGSLFGGDLAGLKDLSQLIANGDIPCEVADNIEKDLWAKMLYNCALNALGAILDVRYGKLGENKFTRIIMNGIAQEVFNVIKAAGYRTHWQSPEDFLEDFYKKLVPPTAQHKSSTLQDILAKKKTEIDALNGAVVKLAEEHRINVPYNLALYNMVKFLEAKIS